MYLVTGREMALIDNKAIGEWEIPQMILMENAGLRVVEEILNLLPNIRNKKIIIVAGKGNNGGDGLVIARHLVNKGADVKVFLYGNKEFQGAALNNYKMAQKLPIKWQKLEDENSLHLLQLSLYYADAVVDAIFGTGLKRPIQGIVAKAVEIINNCSRMVVAVDIPSGINADTGEASDPSVKADVTVTFALPKLGLFNKSGPDFTGKIKIADISMPEKLIESMSIKRKIILRDTIEKYIPRRTTESHKGSYGHLLIIGGSRGMMGAIHLAAGGAFALGVGLVTAAVPSSIQPSLSTSIPELITKPILETSQGTFGLISRSEILSCIAGKSAVVLGPGMGTNDEINSLIDWLLGQIEIPVLIDADALNALSHNLGILKAAKAPVILTPHPGEMARLLGITVQEVQENRIDLARNLAEEYKIWVVLKGNKTVIADPMGKIYINTSGSPALATAGTGDVLAGMLGALLSQQKDITGATCTAVFLHGSAGEKAGKEVGEISCKAGDVIRAAVKIIKEEY